MHRSYIAIAGIAACYVVAISAARAGTVDSAINGTVLDGETMQPVADARITAPGMLRPVRCGNDGSFRLPARPSTSAPLTLSVSAPGYEVATQEVSADADEVLVIVLYKLGALGEVIEVKNRPPRAVAAGTQVFDRSVLTKIPGGEADALAVVRSLPGVSVTTGFRPGSGIVIRGSAPQESRITIDGVTIPRAYHVFGNNTIVPTRMIESLEFTPGGFGAEEGRATGGIVALALASAVTQPARADINVSFLEIGAVGSTPFADGKWGVAGGLRRSTLDLLLPLVLPNNGDITFSSFPVYYDGQLRVDYRRSTRHRYAVTGLVSYDEVALVRSAAVAALDGGPTTFSNSTWFARAIASWHYDAPQLKNRFVASLGADKLRIAIGVGNFGKFDTVPAMLRDDVRMPFTKGQLRFGVEGVWDAVNVVAETPLPPSEGEPPKRFDERSRISVNEIFRRYIVGAYSAVDFELAPTLKLTPSARIDYFARQDRLTFSPRLQLQQRFGNVTAKGAMGRYTRGPDNDAQAVATDLRPEVANQYVLGIEAPVKTWGNVAATVFYNQRSDLVSTDPQVAANNSTGLPYVSTGSGRTTGAEVLLKYLNGNFFGWVSYTLALSERRDSPTARVRLTDYDQTHNAIGLVSYTVDKWLFSARWQYTTGTPYTEVIGATYDMSIDRYVPGYGGLNASRLTAAHQLDLRIERQWTFARWSLAAYLDANNAYRNARVVQYQWNPDYTERKAVKEFIAPPSIGVRGWF